MRRTRAEEILGEWGVRDVTPPSLQERDRLERARDLNPLDGTPLRRRLGRSQTDPDRYVSAGGGPLPYMLRLRRIEEETAGHLARLAEAREAHRDDPVGWRRLVERWDFSEVNELIDRHNRFYPIEAQLAMDPRSRDFVTVGGRSRREPLDAAWVTERFGD